jgi:hypothetical protein
MEVAFSGDLWFWRGPSPYHFVTLPADESAQVKAVSSGVTYGWGMVPVTAMIGSTSWTTSLFPKDGGYLLPVKDAVRTAESLEIGDTVGVVVAITA